MFRRETSRVDWVIKADLKGSGPWSEAVVISRGLCHVEGLYISGWLMTLCISILLLSSDAYAQGIAPEICDNSAIISTTPSSDFSLTGNGETVYHHKTRLSWKRCSAGQAWDGTECQGSPMGYTWREALEWASEVGDGWRLPNVKELQSIVEYCRQSPAINREVFPYASAINNDYWTSTSNRAFADWARDVDFRFGQVGSAPKEFTRRIRLVRDMKP